MTLAWAEGDYERLTEITRQDIEQARTRFELHAPPIFRRLFDDIEPTLDL